MNVIEGHHHQRDLVIDCDVVVVGSGAGGAVTAAELSAQGLDVVILEDGGYYKTEDYSTDAYEAVSTLYRDGGAQVIWGSPNIVFGEGRALGGSTVVNGGLCWRTPERILKRWRWEFGVDHVEPEDLEPFYDRVEARINSAYHRRGVAGPDATRFNEGARRLGYNPTEVRRNQIDCVGTDNCAFGCPAGAKQSVLLSYIPRAAAAGARIYTDTKVSQIITRRGAAEGVAGTITNRFTGQKFKVRVHAKTTFLCCGALQTTVLLKGNRLANSSRRLGKNFLCHPNAKAVAIYPHTVRGWEGAHQLWQVHDFLDEGVLLAVTYVPPALLGSAIPFIGDENLELMMAVDRMVTGGILVEDTTTGVVWRGPGGHPIPRYKLAPHDVHMMKRGVSLLAEIYFESGAEKVLTPFFKVPILTSADDIKKIWSTPMSTTDMEDLVTVHAMGTAHMGSDPRRSVVDSWGETHDVRNLFINDASIIPTGLGVNPQVTIMALATRNAHHFLDRWGSIKAA